MDWEAHESPRKVWRKRTRPLCRNDPPLPCQTLLRLIGCVPECPHHFPVVLPSASVFWLPVSHQTQTSLCLCALESAALGFDIFDIPLHRDQSCRDFVRWVLTPGLLAFSICHHQNTERIPPCHPVSHAHPRGHIMLSGLRAPFSGLAEIKAPKASLLSPGPALAALPAAHTPLHAVAAAPHGSERSEGLGPGTKALAPGPGGRGKGEEPGPGPQAPAFSAGLMPPDCFEGEGPWSMGNSGGLWVCIPSPSHAWLWACPIGGCPRTRCSGRSKWLLTASSVHVCAHTPLRLPRDS